MAKNDVYLLDGILDQYPVEDYATPDRGTLFEVFCLEQLLKSYDLKSDDIKDGHLDAGLDGGIDGGYIFINGNYVPDVSSFQMPKSDIRIDVFIINCKHHDTFREATLNTLVATYEELFDLSRDDAELKGKYHKGIMDFRSRFATIYKKVAVKRPRLNFYTLYASRGDIAKVGGSVRGRAAQIDRIVENLFSGAKSDFNFIGASELVERYRNTKSFDLELPFSGQVSGDNDGYILFAKLEDYFNFITDEEGQLGHSSGSFDGGHPQCV